MEASLFFFLLLLFSVASLVKSRPLHHLLQDQTHVFSLLDYGAVGDGITDDSQAFREAWNAVCDSSLSSPVLHVPPHKTFLLKPLVLEGPCKSNNIHVEMLGNMVAPSDPSEWQCDIHENSYHCPSWLTFNHVNDLYITGGEDKFTIDGRGQNWWNLSCHKTKNCGRLPMMLVLRHSNNVHISNINIVNSPNMHMFIQDSTWVYAHNINISSPERSPNTDGIHIQHSQNVFIYDSNIGTGDDCISIADGSSHLNIDSITCGPGHGISIGSLGIRGETETVEYVHVSNVDFSGTSNGVRIKTWQGGKGYARNIVFEKIRCRDATNPIIIDQHYCLKHSCSDEVMHMYDPCFSLSSWRVGIKMVSSAVKVSNVTYNQIYGTSDRTTAIKFDCSKTVPCTDIVVTDVNISSTRKGKKTSAYCQNVYGRAQGQVVPSVPCLNRM